MPHPDDENVTEAEVQKLLDRARESNKDSKNDK